jgi:hypothetical protein
MGIGGQVAELGDTRSQWALSGAEKVAYSIVGVVALLTAVTGVYLSAALDGMSQPLHIPVSPILVVFAALMYVARHRKRTDDDVRGEAFFGSETARPDSDGRVEQALQPEAHGSADTGDYWRAG